MTGPQFFERGCWERGGKLFWVAGGGGEFAVIRYYIKNQNQLRSEIFVMTKNVSKKMFFSVITTNLKWKILIKDLVTFKK